MKTFQHESAVEGISRLSARQHEILAAESTTERNTRLQQMRERHTAETTEGRHVRLVCDRAQHREQQNVQSQLPLFQVFHPSQDVM